MLCVLLMTTLSNDQGNNNGTALYKNKNEGAQ